MELVNSLVAFFLGMYNNNKNSLSFLIEGYVPTYSFLKTYNSFVNQGLLVQIENLLIEDKISLVTECRSTGLKFTNQTLSDAARILHTLKFINENI